MGTKVEKAAKQQLDGFRELTRMIKDKAQTKDDLKALKGLKGQLQGFYTRAVDGLNSLSTNNKADKALVQQHLAAVQTTFKSGDVAISSKMTTQIGVVKAKASELSNQFLLKVTDLRSQSKEPGANKEQLYEQFKAAQSTFETQMSEFSGLTKEVDSHIAGIRDRMSKSGEHMLTFKSAEASGYTKPPSPGADGQSDYSKAPPPANQEPIYTDAPPEKSDYMKPPPPQSQSEYMKPPPPPSAIKDLQGKDKPSHKKGSMAKAAGQPQANANKKVARENISPRRPKAA